MRKEELIKFQRGKDQEQVREEEEKWREIFSC